jgi:hypothetical protein
MEPRDDSSLDCLELNRKLITGYKPYDVFSEATHINEKKKFIITIVHNRKIILKAEYVILGAFSSEKNVWIWSDQSNVHDKKMMKLVFDLRKQIITQLIDTNISPSTKKRTGLVCDQGSGSEKFKKFIENNHSVLPGSELYDNMCNLESMLNYKIISMNDSNIIVVFLIKKIISNNMDE